MADTAAIEPLRVLALGAGVQSSALALMASRKEPGIPEVDVAIFADTQWEPKAVYEHLDWLEKQLAFPVIRTTFGDLGKATRENMTEHGYKYCEIPVFLRDYSTGKIMMTSRNCTDRYKIRPMRKAMREEMRRRGAKKVVQMFGISTDEYTRMRDSDAKFITNSYPLIDNNFSRADCLAWFEERYPGRTLPRSACLGCPYHSDREWMRIATGSPDEFKATVELEADMRKTYVHHNGGKETTPFFHSSARPLDEVMDDLLSIQSLPFEEEGLWGAECAGVCGV